jgi:hypothetical protein
VLVALREKGIPFNVVGDHIELDGFGRAGIVQLKADANVETLLLYSRQNRVVPVEVVEDIYAEAWHWLRATITRMDGVYSPHENWREAFIEQGWLPAGWKPYTAVTMDLWHEGEERRTCSTSA